MSESSEFPYKEDNELTINGIKMPENVTYTFLQRLEEHQKTQTLKKKEMQEMIKKALEQYRILMDEAEPTTKV